MARKHKLEEVLSALKAKGCVITLATPITKNEVVQEPYTIHWKGCVLGNGSWGKIDYLVKVHGFKLTPSI